MVIVFWIISIHVDTILSIVDISLMKSDNHKVLCSWQLNCHVDNFYIKTGCRCVDINHEYLDQCCALNIVPVKVNAVQI